MQRPGGEVAIDLATADRAGAGAEAEADRFAGAFLAGQPAPPPTPQGAALAMKTEPEDWSRFAREFIDDYIDDFDLPKGVKLTYTAPVRVLAPVVHPDDLPSLGLLTDWLGMLLRLENALAGPALRSVQDRDEVRYLRQRDTREGTEVELPATYRTEPPTAEVAWFIAVHESLGLVKWWIEKKLREVDEAQLRHYADGSVETRRDHEARVLAELAQRTLDALTGSIGGTIGHYIGSLFTDDPEKIVAASELGDTIVQAVADAWVYGPKRPKRRRPNEGRKPARKRRRKERKKARQAAPKATPKPAPAAPRPAPNRGAPYQDGHAHLPQRRRDRSELDAVAQLELVSSWKRAKKVLKRNKGVAIGKPLKSADKGHEILARLARGDATALAAIGVKGYPKKVDPSGREWVLIEAKAGYVIYAGAYDGVVLPMNVRKLAHIHPGPRPTADVKPDGRIVEDLPIGAGDAGLTYDEIKGLPEQTGLLPSGSDVHAISDGTPHVIYTRYVHRGGKRIANPEKGDRDPRVELHLSGTKVVRWHERTKVYIYETAMSVKDANGVELWSGMIYTTWMATVKKGAVAFDKPGALRKPLPADWSER